MKSIIIVLALAAATRIASADDAADHFAKGTRYYNIQEWANALKEYRDAYSLDPKPETLWAIAQTQRLSGDCRSAILTYKAFMRSASPAGANAAAEWIKQCEADLDAQRKAVEATTPPTEPQQPAPSSKAAPSATPPPSPPVVVAPPPPAPAHHRSAALDPLGDVLLVVGIGGVAAGATMFAIGASDASSAPNQATVGGWHGVANSASRDQLIGGIVGGVGVVCTALAIWRFTSVSHHDNTEHASIGVAPTTGGALAWLRASF
jgi:hypothetical protein